MNRLLLLAGCLAALPLVHAQTRPPDKISPRLWELTRSRAQAITAGAASGGGNSARQPASRVTPVTVPTPGEQVVINAIAENDPQELARSLSALGADHVAVAGRVVSARLPLSAIPGLAHVSSLRFAQPAEALALSGLVKSQGDGAQYSDQARAFSGLTGAGIRVGILSDSFNTRNGMAAGIASGDLPADILILKEYSPGQKSDEGRAMGEIVYDVAPGASLAFHTAFLGQADFANGIRRLAAAGCQVIVDDVIYLDEPMFADGVIAQAVDEVTANGIVYFSAAGNAARQSYEAPFVNAGGYHDFDPGPGVDTVLNIRFGGGITYFVLQWVDRYASTGLNNPGAATDLDLELVDGYGNPITYYDPAFMQTLPMGSFVRNIGRDPVEVFACSVGSVGEYGLRIRLTQGTPPPRVKLLWYTAGTVLQKEWVTSSSTVFGHMNAAGALAVGAAGYCRTPAYGWATPQLQSYSSYGGTPIYFLPDGQPTYEVRAKPDFVAPDGGNTTFFGWTVGGLCSDGDKFPNFWGTSAAAPHAAGVAALMLQARPRATPERIRWLLQATAIDMNQPDFDFGSGYGLVHAQNALAALTQPPPQLLGVVSRKTHGRKVPPVDYDLPLALSGRPTVDGRIDSRLNLIFTFDKPLLAADAQILQGNAQFAEPPVIDGQTVHLRLQAVANLQWVTVALANVLATDGSEGELFPVTVGVLGGDVNGNGRVSGADVYLLRQITGAYTNPGNFPRDVDLSGALNGADVYQVRLRSGHYLPEP